MKKVILASASPRRLELLRMLGLNVLPIVPNVDESAVEESIPANLAEKRAKMKAKAVWGETHPEGCPIIGADTLVELNWEILGKPRSVAEAKEMLRRLSGKKHYVHTGLSVIYSGTETSTVVSSAVYFRELTDREIDEYVMSGEPMDKAGGYGIQGRAGAFVEKIEGDFFAVMGLPLCRLSTLLRESMGLELTDLK